MIDLSALSALHIDRMVRKLGVRMMLVCLSVSVPLSTLQASTLDPQARYRAQQVADGTRWQQPRSNPEDTHPLGVQTLSIETLESKDKPAFPVIRVYQYHYDLMQARMLTINTDQLQLLKSQAVNSVHLPLSQAEIDHASRLLQARSDILEQLQAEQIKRGHIAFRSLAELDVKASIHEPFDTTDQCHRQRCALLSLFDDTRTVFSTEPVINLQSGQIIFIGRP